LMLKFAVNDGRHTRAGVAFDVFPDIEDRTAGRVDDNAAFLSELIDFLSGYTERRNQHHIIFTDAIILARSFWKEPHAHPLQPIVDMWVVDDLAGEKNPVVREFGQSLVGVLDGAFDAITKTELHGEQERQVAGLQARPVSAHEINNLAPIILMKL